MTSRTLVRCAFPLILSVGLVMATSLSRARAQQNPSPATAAGAGQFHDSHFHLTNYIQEGTDVRKYVDIMGARVGRSTLFGIPLQQTWDYGNTGDFAPTYYLQTDAPLYYYSFTDAAIAMAYRSLNPQQQARLDPDDHRFQPDGHVRRGPYPRVLKTFPGVFSGIGEFTIHKEFVSPKVAGGTASLTDPALDRVMDFAGEVGLVVIFHNDIDMPFPRPNQEPYQLAQLKALFTAASRRRRSSGRTAEPAASSGRSTISSRSSTRR